jgi:NAD(P)-dependent dehydrogenase (short-subunit alcohol dehydrogenase family)
LEEREITKEFTNTKKKKLTQNPHKRKMGGWSTKEMPLQGGKTIIVTGANKGIGFYTALELGRVGANVTCVVRDAKAGQEAITEMKKIVPGGLFELAVFDISDLAQVRRFAAEFSKQHDKLDTLINNAGVMRLPERELSNDGFEMQLATNHLGHFALTGLLLPLLQRSSCPRVVVVSSVAAYNGVVPDPIDFSKSKLYDPGAVYAESKLANLLFMRQLAKKYPSITAVGAHPGLTSTDIYQHSSYKYFTWAMQHPETGALPILRAATEEGLKSETYFGPRVGMWIGAPYEAWRPPAALSDPLCQQYWAASEQATHVTY